MIAVIWNGVMSADRLGSEITLRILRDTRTVFPDVQAANDFSGRILWNTRPWQENCGLNRQLGSEQVSFLQDSG